MRWIVHGERRVYDSPWMSVALADVEIPGGARFEHHVMRAGADAAATLVTDADRGVLLLWRHRFTTDTWGWEIPAGRVDDGETPEETAARETLEETGWRPGPLRHLVSYHPVNGQSDLRFHLFGASGATREGDPLDWTESERVEWLALAEVRRVVRDGDVRDGFSLTALCWWLAFGPAPPDGGT